MQCEIMKPHGVFDMFIWQVVEINVKVESAGTHNVHNNAFFAEEKILKSELEAMRDCDPSSARHWIVRADSSCP